MKSRTAGVIACVAVSVGSLAADRQDQMDMELRMKWATAELVHYDVAAEYSAPTPVLARHKTAVKDRFELSFDYVPLKVAIVGKPIFKNSVSTVSTVFEDVCMQPQVNGPYEHLDIIDAKPGMGALELTIKRTFPPGARPGINETTGKCELTPVEGKVDTLAYQIPVIPGTVFGTPMLAPGHVRIGESASENNTVTIGKDQKTIVVDAGNGWKYTYSLRIAK